MSYYRELVEKAKNSNIPIREAYISWCVSCSLTSKDLSDVEYDDLCNRIKELSTYKRFNILDFVYALDAFGKGVSSEAIDAALEKVSV